jgi:hypothetical protein
MRENLSSKSLSNIRHVSGREGGCLLVREETAAMSNFRANATFEMPHVQAVLGEFPRRAQMKARRAPTAAPAAFAFSCYARRTAAVAWGGITPVPPTEAKFSVRFFPGISSSARARSFSVLD